MVLRSISISFERRPEEPPESSVTITSTEDDTSPVDAVADVKEQAQVTHYDVTNRRCLQGFQSCRETQWSWTGRFNFKFSSADGGWVSIQPPSWLARSTHVFIASKALGGPHLTLRRYETIYEWDSQVEAMLEKDDWPSLETHLRTTGISPFSSDRLGANLVYASLPRRDPFYVANSSFHRRHASTKPLAS
jgi:hypothetical protein